ncbi:shikimate kinase [Pseudofulvibacter geojedonensis]|uniref:Shikimate kinase n=1 Tax=Pseudofulvibacter geojedonensis TaxID=1123758 RepID=A0ABW3I227_9FLAO
MIIVLLGYMGCGKSTIGKELAKTLSFSFVDLDNYIEKKEAMSVTNIFKSKGEIYFRKKEHEYLKELTSNSDKLILSLGGGTPCYANNMRVLDREGINSIYLSVSVKELSKRLFNEKEERPLIANIETEEELQSFIGIHLFERSSFYSQARTVIKTDGLTIKNIVENIIGSLY